MKIETLLKITKGVVTFILVGSVFLLGQKNWASGGDGNQELSQKPPLPDAILQSGIDGLSESAIQAGSIEMGKMLKDLNTLNERITRSNQELNESTFNYEKKLRDNLLDIKTMVDTELSQIKGYTLTTTVDHDHVDRINVKITFNNDSDPTQTINFDEVIQFIRSSKDIEDLMRRTLSERRNIFSRTIKFFRVVPERFNLQVFGLMSEISPRSYPVFIKLIDALDLWDKIEQFGDYGSEEKKKLIRLSLRKTGLDKIFEAYQIRELEGTLIAQWGKLYTELPRIIFLKSFTEENKSKLLEILAVIVDYNVNQRKIADQISLIKEQIHLQNQNKSRLVKSILTLQILLTKIAANMKSLKGSGDHVLMGEEMRKGQLIDQNKLKEVALSSFTSTLVNHTQKDSLFTVLGSIAEKTEPDVFLSVLKNLTQAESPEKMLVISLAIEKIIKTSQTTKSSLRIGISDDLNRNDPSRFKK